MKRKLRKNVQTTSEEESYSESDSADSDVTVNARITRRKAPPKRKQGKPARNSNKKKQRVSDDSDSDSSPQPSTSAVPDRQNNSTENDSSGSESEDLDYGLVKERSVKKRTSAWSKRKKQPKQNVRTKKQKIQNNSFNGVNSQKGSQSRNHMNTSNKKSTKSQLSTSNDITFDTKQVENLAQKLVYFLLIEDQKKYAIKRKAITAHVFKDDVYSPKLYAVVLKKANVILKKTYGMELMELENQKDSYLIVNILGRELGIHDYVEVSRLKQQQHGLILYLLTIIFMNENVVTEVELTRSLKPLGIDLTSKKLHPAFGDVKKYITTELVKQMYLNYECISKDPPNYEITWGLRAKQEFDKRDLLQFVCQIIDDTTPENWRIQFKDAENSANLKPNDDD